jgi:hypothetical protein
VHGQVGIVYDAIELVFMQNITENLLKWNFHFRKIKRKRKCVKKKKSKSKCVCAKYYAKLIVGVKKEKKQPLKDKK